MSLCHSLSHEILRNAIVGDKVLWYLSACFCFDVVTPERVGDIAISLLVLSATINKYLRRSAKY